MSTSHKPRLNGNFQRDRKRPGFCVEGCQCHANHSLSIGWLAHTWSQMSFPERLSPLLGCTQATGASYPQKMHLLVSSKTFCILSTSSTSGISSSTSPEGEGPSERGDTMALSCPSNWLKEGSLSLRPTDTTRRCPSEAGGEGRMLRGQVEGAPPGAGEAGVDSESDC